MGAMLLRQSADNGRYFATPDGRIRYLSGGYEGSEFQDYVFGGGTTSDFHTALDVLSRHGGNLLRLWTSESSSGNPALRGAMQMPWVRSAVCCAVDGANKFDLSNLDIGNLVSPDINANAYFERMRARVLAARAEGVYVSIMLWHSFGWEAGLRIPGSKSWMTHPFNSRNNVNDVNGDVDGDGHGLELGSVEQSFTPYQEAYVRQVIETVGDLDNVLYEICNECYDSPAMNAWQDHFVDFIKRYESARIYRHPVGMTSLQNFNNRVLASGAADFVAPGGPPFEETPPVSTGAQVSILDMDHVVPCTGANDARWPWKAFTRGHNLWYIYCQGYGRPNASEGTVMERMGQTAGYANRMDLRHSVPVSDPSRCSTGYCLMGPDFVLGFLPGGGAITLDLNAEGAWSVEWFEPASGNTSVMPSVRDGMMTLTAPFPGDAVVFLVRNVPPTPGS
ncbi:MAG: cellulase family glycosylhydrolase [Nitrospiraceae bacterium]